VAKKRAKALRSDFELTARQLCIPMYKKCFWLEIEAPAPTSTEKMDVAIFEDS